MSKVEMFKAPAGLQDFDGIPGLAEAWHTAVSSWFDSSVASIPHTFGNTGGTAQFYNPASVDPGEKPIEQPIIWNAFPKELLKQFGRDRALIEADRLQTLQQYSGSFDLPIYSSTFYRPQNEYCEWHAVRDPDTNKIVKIAFSSEPPEYWRALFGDALPTDGNNTIAFPGDRKKVLELYRELVSPAVQMNDLICK